MKRILVLGLWLGTLVFGWGLGIGGLGIGGLGWGAGMAPAMAQGLPSPASEALALPQTTAALAPARLFAQNCAGCHPGGGNIIRRGKTLQLKALVRNQLETPGAIAQLIAQGRGNMSAYGDRLSPEQIEALAVYVLAQAEVNWK